MTSIVRAQSSLTPMHRGQLPAVACRHVRVDGLQRASGRNAYPSGITPSTIMSPSHRTTGSRTEIRLGARAHHTPRPDREYYLQAADRLGGNRACLAVARKLLKRSYHTLRELGDEALQPA